MPENNKVGVGFGVMVFKANKVLLGKRHVDPEKADSELHGEGTWTMLASIRARLDSPVEAGPPSLTILNQ